MAQTAGGESGGPSALVTYHCVCGEPVELDPATGGKCTACARRYSADVARYAAIETVHMPRGANESIDLEAIFDPSSRTTSERRVADFDEPAEIDLPSPQAGNELPLPEDRKMGHFRIVSRLGRGGMGDVYRALDESLQRFVALKVLRASETSSLSGTTSPLRLLQEARAQARVNHPGVVHIYYVSPDPERPFLAMELVPGPTLADRLKAGPLHYAETIDIGIQIARALRQAARYDVVHGDIKPGNILLTGDGSVKLSDFGLARRLSGEREVPAGSITGTPHYLPPEIIAGADPDVRSDMYALGVMLFEMTFGRRPYTIESGTLEEQIEAHRSAPVEFPDPWPVDLPEGWRDVLARLLEKDPDDRYQSHDELLSDLERLKPVGLPTAGRLARLLAWVIDLFLAVAAGVLLLAPLGFLASQGLLPAVPVVEAFLVATTSAIVLLGAAALQMSWKTSPGKSLFQLRIVDRHGLTPGPAILASRTIFQLLPVWGTDIQSIFDTLGLEQLGLIESAGVAAITLTDAAFALIRRDGRSLHDLLLRTRVALDTRTTATGT